MPLKAISPSTVSIRKSNTTGIGLRMTPSACSSRCRCANLGRNDANRIAVGEEAGAAVHHLRLRVKSADFDPLSDPAPGVDLLPGSPCRSQAERHRQSLRATPPRIAARSAPGFDRVQLHRARTCRRSVLNCIVRQIDINQRNARLRVHGRRHGAIIRLSIVSLLGLLAGLLSAPV